MGENLDERRQRLIRVGEQINAATVAGNLGGAFGVVKGLSIPEATEAMLYAGFSIGVGRGPGFWRYVQEQLAAACQHRVSGEGLHRLGAVTPAQVSAAGAA